MRGRILTVTIAGLLAATMGAPATAQEDETSSVDSLSAVADAGTVTVTGEASFVDVPQLVGEDPEGDCLTCVTGAPLGTDLTGAIIARPAANTLRFTLEIADQPPVAEGVPETVHYNWEIATGTGPNFLLQAIRTSQYVTPGSTDPMIRVLQRGADGSCGCQQRALVPGRMAGGVVEWDVPMTILGVQEGSIISGVLVVSTLGASGNTWFVNLGGDEVSMESDYRVPGPTVDLGIASAGTDPSAVPLTVSAQVGGDGSFSGTLDASGLEGEHVVVARACFGSNSCGLASTEVTL